MFIVAVWGETLKNLYSLFSLTQVSFLEYRSSSIAWRCSNSSEAVLMGEVTAISLATSEGPLPWLAITWMHLGSGDGNSSPGNNQILEIMIMRLWCLKKKKNSIDPTVAKFTAANKLKNYSAGRSRIIVESVAKNIFTLKYSKNISHLHIWNVCLLVLPYTVKLVVFNANI